MTIIGIDPGVKTGYAEWDVKRQKFINVFGKNAVFAEQEVLNAISFFESKDIILVIEDARMRKWYGSNSNAKRQGAGSVKRDSQRWEEFCKYHQIPYLLKHPKDNNTKVKAGAFKAMTGYKDQTNEHSRDAAMLVYGITEQQFKILQKTTK